LGELCGTFTRMGADAGRVGEVGASAVLTAAPLLPVD